MTFLELCQAMVRKASGISGTIVSVDGQSGEAARVVDWVATAYLYIQNLHADWKFLRNDVQFNTVAATQRYTCTAAGVANLGEWLFAPGWRCYATAIGVRDEQPVRFLDYDSFKQRYLYGANREVAGRPQVVTEKPDQSLLFWPTPDAVYTVIGEQYRSPHLLVANADKPLFAAAFHDVILHRALMMYGAREGDQTEFAAAQNEANRIIGQMESKYLPDWEQAEPLV